MPGLGLDGLQRHASLTQPGETGVAQLVARRMGQPGTAAGAGKDLIDSGRRQRMSAAGTLEDHEHRIRR